MKAAYDRDTQRVCLVFDSVEEAERFAADVERESGFILELVHRLALDEEVTVALTVGMASAVC